MRIVGILLLFVVGCTTPATRESATDGGSSEAGAQGAVGPQGPMGAQGPAGPQGPQGPAGVSNVPGPSGPQGVAGPQGAIGPQGPAGVSNVPGPQGPAGPQGGAGPQGSQGPMGAIGATGATGPAGPIGPSVYVYASNGTKLGVAATIYNASMTPMPAFITLQGGLPANITIGMAPQPVYYVNNDCTGHAFVNANALEGASQYYWTWHTTALFQARSPVLNETSWNSSMQATGCIPAGSSGLTDSMTPVQVAAISWDIASTLPWQLKVQ